MAIIGVVVFLSGMILLYVAVTDESIGSLAGELVK